MVFGLSLSVLGCLLFLGLAFREPVSWWIKKRSLMQESEAWREYEGHLYRLTPGRGSWHDAQKYAQKMGGHLVAITSKEEQIFINESFKKEFKSTGAWIGCSDHEEEGKWQWTNGESFKYSNWRVNEPNNATNRGEDFGVLNHYRPDGRWNDLSPDVSVLPGLIELSPP